MWMRIFIRGSVVAGAAVVVWAIWVVGSILYGFYGALDVGLWWPETLAVLGENWGIAVAIYALISLNAAGFAEFRFGRSFAKAFVLAIPMTPPLMIALWARRGRAGV